MPQTTLTDTPTQPDTVQKVIAAIRQGYQDVEWRNFDVNEADTRALLITPVLKALGYEARYRKSENSGFGNRPDESLFVKPVTSVDMPVAVFIEAKPLGTDFDLASGGGANSPNRQIQRYLLQHPASALNTLGVLTDGFKWRIYERVSETDNRLVADLDLKRIGHIHSRRLLDAEDESVGECHVLVGLISRLILEDEQRVEPEPVRRTLADGFFASVIANQHPSDMLKALTGSQDLVTSSDIADRVQLQGVAKDIHDHDWWRYAYSIISSLSVVDDVDDQSRFEGEGGLTVAAVRFGGGTVPRYEAAATARAFAQASPDNASLVFCYSILRQGLDVQVASRWAAFANGKVNMTAEFDPVIPLPSAKSATNTLMAMVRDESLRHVKSTDLMAPLAVSQLRQQFYGLVAEWVTRQQQGKSLEYRQAVLQHLIRVMFTWILKESGQLPGQLFEEAFARENLEYVDGYHDEMLGFLFHERLNVPKQQRVAHSIDRIEAASNAVPYLNGSLFVRNRRLDGLLDLKAGDYWGSDPGGLGIFTILSRFHWTLDEHRPGVSEQTLDPELLSNLFERLIAPTDVGPENLDRMPGGTYYTPADVADEMVKDALTAATRDSAPASMDEAEIRSLYDERDGWGHTLSKRDTARLVDRIGSLKVFDPAVGSGEFLFSTLVALRTALGRLGSASGAEEIVRRQLFGQDIHPLAVQITRLRLFVAMRAGRAASRPLADVEDGDLDGINGPLPNLEARIVCADTLETVADPDWRPDHPHQFDSSDPDIRAALIELACNRERWFYAYSEDDKRVVLDADNNHRDVLRTLLARKGNLATKELWGFADAQLFGDSQRPALTDPRLLFYSSDWEGFDVVIGNPPYEIPYRDLDDAKTRQEHRAALNRLKDEKSYKTTNVRDMFSLFCEAGLALAKPTGGVVTMIVPLSMAFGRRETTLRNRMSKRCASIGLRHYDQRPDAIFNESPTVSSPGNSQRATIFTAIRGDASVRVTTSGLTRWPSSERAECLRVNRKIDVTDLQHGNGGNGNSSQWPRIPTYEVKSLVGAVLEQTTPVFGNDLCEGVVLALPKSCRYFMSALPAGRVKPRRETVVTVADNDQLLLTLVALNGHVGYAWWTVFGDGLDVKVSDFDGFTIPDAWIDAPEELLELGRQLVSVIDDNIVETVNRGTTWRNVDFHSGRPDLIEQIDRLYIAALGLPEEPLLPQLRVMRSNSSWRYGE